VSARTAVRRAELALAAVVVTAILLLAIVALDAVRFHLPALARGEETLDAHAAVLLALCVLQAVVLWRVVRSLRRQVAATRRVAALPRLAPATVAGRELTVLADGRPAAFCAGAVRPRIYVTSGAVERLAPEELRAVADHEAEHARRRDPLKQLAVQALVDGFAFLPGLRRLALSQAAVADLVADAAAVASAGTARPLAAAMLRLDDPAPERIDQLLGRPLAGVPAVLLAAAVVATAALAAIAALLLTAATDPALPAVLLLALAAPALVAARRSYVP
jgi:Zn-dependent protease with chaperone function